MATFVLVSGAWHAGWCWERVVPLLQSQGHRALAPDLLGMGRDGTPLTSVTLAGWADQIADIIRAEPEPVVLVGHSRGGIVISETAERVPERISTLVYLTALLLPDGATQADVMGLVSPQTAALVRPGPEGGSLVAPEAVGPVFYNTTAPAWVERAAEMLGPEPSGGFSAPMKLSPGRYGSAPRAYIECALDRAIGLDVQRRMQAALPCDPVITLQTDHSPFFSSPEELAASLVAIAAQAPSRG
jgi:pimeloyl-ACP methyl ester carboxylesterase